MKTVRTDVKKNDFVKLNSFNKFFAVFVLLITSVVTVAQTPKIPQSPKATGQEQNVMLTEVPMVSRTRLFPKMLLFPRIQAQFDLFINYLDGYHRGNFNDRPLFFDRTLAGESPPLYDKMNSQKSFLRQLEVSRQFADGLGLLNSRPERFFRMTAYADSAKIKDVILFEVQPETLTNHELMTQFIEHSIKSPAVLKYDGKLVISSYAGDRFTPEQWASILPFYREKYPGKLLFMVEVRSIGYYLNNLYNKGNGKISSGEIENVKAKIRKYLDVCDGINFSGSNHIIAQKAGFPAYVFNADAYEKFIVPVMMEIVAEPAYTEKILGLSAHKTYCTTRWLDSNIDEEGTRSLRRSLGIALASSADYVVLPEWNEVNENTHIEPTVSDAQTNRRVINALTGVETPELNPRYPNLILSFRQENELGTPVPVELLGLPDKEGSPSTVTLRFRTPAGKTVKEYPAVKFSHREIQESFYLEPSGQFADHRYLVPELEIIYAGKKIIVSRGLPTLRLTTAANKYYRYVKIPLRDMPDPEKIITRWSAGDGRIKVTGSANTDSPINSIELMADDVPLAAVDPKNEFAPPKGYKLFRWTRFTAPIAGFSNDTVQLTAIEGDIIAHSPYQLGMSGMAVPSKSGKTLAGPIGHASQTREFLFFATPDATLDIKTRGEHIQVPIVKILEFGQYRHVQDKGVSWQLEAVRELPELPFPIANKNVSFELECVVSDRPDPVYYLRIVTAAGQVFRSEALYLKPPASTKIRMPVWDLCRDQSVTLEVPKHLAHDIDYQFSPESGDLLRAIPDSRDYYALIGGYSYYTHWGDPGWNFLNAPKWKHDNNAWILDFAPGSYILVPQPVFSRSAFTIELDFKVSDSKHQTLLNLYGDVMPVNIQNGRLEGYLVTSRGKFEWSSSVVVELDKWHTLRIIYDLSKFTVLLDGMEIASRTVAGRISNGQLLSIGGHPLGKKFFSDIERMMADKTNSDTDPGFQFSGSLRSLKIANFPK